MKRRKIVAISFIIISFFIIIIHELNENRNEKIEQQNVEEYIEMTSEEIKDETTEETSESEQTQNKKVQSSIAYEAILEIPKISLKRGIVDATRTFNSINYAISADLKSNYPDEMGNFILYAHSGNSGVGFFRNLDQLNLNDEIFVYYNGTKYIYNVINKYEILKTGTAKVINSKNDKYITLITCNKRRKGYQIVIEGKINSIEVY